ncbi:MAG: TonB-dependent receptor [Candidatus Nitronauta litoralis]|uniref:TonB-dependent receptor n=1 Tax=Candidatus Nitronauta litoralis TaxID=2705533 RepID=A0A7T0BYG8_9BACT|nr:MAG: TonB-dependent receptor [Candidatus Nitronauta litoralis]
MDQNLKLSGCIPGWTLYPQRTFRTLATGLIFVWAGFSSVCFAAQEELPQKPFQIAEAITLHTFHIRAQDLQSALLEFSKKLNLQLLYPTELTQGMHTLGLDGTFTTEDGLRRLLEGTGLKYKFVGTKSITLSNSSDQIELSPIDVVGTDNIGYLSQKAISATRSGADAHDISQNIEVYNRNLLEDTRSNSIGEVLRFSPGASWDGDQMGPFGDNFLFRGFFGNEVVNGLRGGTGMITQRDTQNVERVEVLKGPASVMYGQMEPSATVNVVTKQPLDHFFAEGGVQFGTFDDYRLTGDVSGPVTDNKKVKFRINAAYEDNESYIDFFTHRHIFVAPVVSVDFTTDTRLTVEATYSNDHWSSINNGQPASGLLTPNINGKYDPATQISEPNFFGTTRGGINVMSRLEHRFNDWLVARANFSWMQNRRTFQEGFANSFLADERTLTRGMFYTPGDTSDDFYYLVDVTANFDTGPVSHDLLLGVDYQRQTADFHTLSVPMGSIDLFAPVRNVTPLPPLSPTNTFIQDISTFGGFLQDRITVFENFKLVGGFRYTYLDQDTSFARGLGPLVPNNRHDSAWTTQAGAVYQPWEPVSLFVNRMQSFVPQGGTSVGGTPFDPESGTQYEGGVKTTFLDGLLNTTVSYYHITKSNVQTSDPNNPGFSIAIGEVESQGLEASLQSQPLPNLNLIASYGYTDTEITNDNDGNMGNELRNVPQHTFALQSRYDFRGGPLDKFSLNGNIQYTASRQADNANTLIIPGYTKVDMGVNYQPVPKVDIAFWIENLADENIFSTAFGPYVYLQNPRTFHGQLKFRY